MSLSLSLFDLLPCPRQIFEHFHSVIGQIVMQGVVPDHLQIAVEAPKKNCIKTSDLWISFVRFMLRGLKPTTFWTARHQQQHNLSQETSWIHIYHFHPRRCGSARHVDRSPSIAEVSHSCNSLQLQFHCIPWPIGDVSCKVNSEYLYFNENFGSAWMEVSSKRPISIQPIMGSNLAPLLLQVTLIIYIYHHYSNIITLIYVYKTGVTLIMNAY